MDWLWTPCTIIIKTPEETSRRTYPTSLKCMPVKIRANHGPVALLGVTSKLYAKILIDKFDRTKFC